MAAILGVDTIQHTNGTTAVTVGTNGSVTAAGTVTAGGVITGDGSGLTNLNIGTTGKILQMVNVQNGAYASGTSVIPFGNTIPQITEGTEVMTLNITPSSASNKLQIQVVANGSRSNQGDVVFALFVGSTANALICSNIFSDANWRQNHTLNYFMTAGTTSQLTFRLRGGGAGASTFAFNGYAGNSLFGGVYLSSITITELAA